MVPKMDSLVRTNIIKVAESLFVKYGIKSIKVDDICNELRMSKKTFYSEFANKESLIEQVFEQICHKSPEQNSKLQEIETCSNVLDVWLRRPSLETREHHKKYELFMYDLLKFYPQIHAKMTMERKNEVLTIVEALLTKGIQQGLFREDLNVPHLTSFFASWNQIALDDLMRLPKAEHKQYVFTLIDSWTRIVCNHKGMEYYLQHYYNVSESK